MVMNGVPIDLGTVRQKEVIAALALAGGEPVSSAVLIERVWGDQRPITALATLHGYVAGLRRALEPDRPPRAPSTVLVTRGDSYVLRVDAGRRDEVIFERLVGAARRRLEVVEDHLRPRSANRDRETVEAALDELDDALALWRGAPYADLGDAPVVLAHRTRLEDLWRMAVELRAVGQLALGRHDVVRGELEAMSTAYPLHERWWALRAVALARESRQAEALAVLDGLRLNLLEELGVDPSPPLQELRLAVLRQDVSVTDPGTPSASPAPVRRASTRVQASVWKLAGREAELVRLRAPLGLGDDRGSGFAVVTGAAGVGKSRLVEELALDAVEQGWQIAVGHCSQDEGAPPLWPWISILDALDTPFEAPESGLEGGGHFRVRADVARLVREAAEGTPLLLVLEDLHWADASTLGVLRLLAESTKSEQLFVVSTWRSQDASLQDLSGVAEALARRHAVRLDLVGLDEDATRILFEEVSGRAVPGADSAALHLRTRGNPFFVVELARLVSGEEGELDELIGPGAVPAAVTDVVGRRIATQSRFGRSVLQTASVLGDTFDLDTLADVTRIVVDDLLDAVEPALEAGLLEEVAVGVFTFSHALVSDVLRSSMSTTRRARTHRVVAELLEHRPGREAEVARHWRASGPAYVARAWRAAAAAASAATLVYGYVDAADLLKTAVTLQQDDVESGPRDEADLLLQAIDAYRWASMLPELVACVERVIALATEIDDVVLLARAAIQTTHRMSWRSAPFGAINELVTDALRRALDELPSTQSELRCRVLVSLANELREEAPIGERETLCDEAVGLAATLDVPSLQCDVLMHAAVSTWAAPNAMSNLTRIEQAIGLADRAGDRNALAMSRVVRTLLLGELGRPAEMWEQLTTARAEVAELRMVYAELVLDELELAWTAASGRFDDCERLMIGIDTRLRMLMVAGAGDELSVDRHFDLFALFLWQGRPFEALPGLRARIESGLPLDVFTVVALWRSGRRGAARDVFEPVQLHALIDRELAFSSPLRCAVAEAALYLDDADLGRHAYSTLAPYAGRSSGADGLFFGPMDAFLALAARASGDVVAASLHADRAMEMIDAWGLPPARAWLEGLRSTYGF